MDTPHVTPVADSYTLYVDLLAEFAYATECQLATLEYVKGLTRTPQSALRRQEKIASRMVGTCRKHRITPSQACPRLANELLKLMEKP